MDLDRFTLDQLTDLHTLAYQEAMRLFDLGAGLLAQMSAIPYPESDGPVYRGLAERRAVVIAAANEQQDMMAVIGDEMRARRVCRG